MKAMEKTSRIPVDLFYDEEAKNWGFSVDQLHLAGGGDQTREGARDHALEAVAFMLEAVPDDVAGDVEYLEVTLTS